MRIIGLIGGMSWESTAVYYRRINEQVRVQLGGLHSAEVVMRSVDFAGIVELQQADDWDEACRPLPHRPRVERRCWLLLICTNTMHKLADGVQRNRRPSFISSTSQRSAAAPGAPSAPARDPLHSWSRFHLSRLRDRHGIDAIVPAQADRTALHDIIFDELCRGIIRENPVNATSTSLRADNHPAPTASSLAAPRSAF